MLPLSAVIMPGSRDPSPAPVPQDSAEAKTVLRAGASYAGHLTRGCASATRDAQFAEANPSMPAVEILKEHLRDLRQTRNNAMNKYQNFATSLHTAMTGWRPGSRSLVPSTTTPCKHACVASPLLLELALRPPLLSPPLEEEAEEEEEAVESRYRNLSSLNA